MAQIKKETTRNAILEHARRLFKKHGFIRCKMSEIAEAAGMAVANIYVYYPSKLHVFYAVFSPIMTARMERLASEARAIKDKEQRLRFLLSSLWHAIPGEKDTGAHNLIEAIVTAAPDTDKPHELLKDCQDILTELIRECLPEGRAKLMDDGLMSFLLWMAFDGFVINASLHETRDMDKLVRNISKLLLGAAPLDERAELAPAKTLSRVARAR